MMVTFLFSELVPFYLRRMRSVRWLALLTAVLIITACFFTWVSIEGKGFMIGGFFSKGTDQYGKPGLLHTILSSLYIFFVLLNKVWSIRTAFFIAAFNVSWAVRNFALISACSGGECPEKHTGLYVILVGSVLLIIFSGFIDAPKSKVIGERN